MSSRRRIQSIQQQTCIILLFFIGGEFERFDYGKKQNLAVYKADIPPKYDLSRITVPVMLHYAENDYIARPNVS